MIKRVDINFSGIALLAGAGCIGYSEGGLTGLGIMLVAWAVIFSLIGALKG